MQESSKTLVSIVGSSIVGLIHILRPTLHEESRPMFNSNHHASYEKVQHALRRAQFYFSFGFWGGEIFYNFVVLHVFSKMFPNGITLLSHLFWPKLNFHVYKLVIKESQREAPPLCFCFGEWGAKS
jgi:hypothetical protein